MFNGLLRFFPILDVVALCLFEGFIEVVQTVFDEDVVPLNKFLDVRGIDTVAVEVRQYFFEVGI